MGPLLKGVTVCCQDVLGRGGVSAKALREVLLIGGCARVPAFTQTISQQLMSKVHLVPDPELAVVRGAAEWARLAPRRRITGAAPQTLVRALAWQIPCGAGRLMDWLVAEGGSYRTDESLARVRAADDTVWDLTADRSGTLRRHCAAAGDVVATGDVLAITRPRVTGPADLQDEPVRLYDVPGYLPVFGRNGRRLATIGFSGVRTWDAENGNEIGHWEFKANINANGLDVAVKTNGDVLLAFYENGRVFLWDAAGGTRPLAWMKDFRALHLSSDGTRVCTVEAKRVTVLDPHGRKLHRVKFNKGNLSLGRERVAISSDGQELAIASTQQLLTWNVKTRNRVAINLNLDTTELSSRSFTPDAGALLLGTRSQLAMIDLPSGGTRWNRRPACPVRGADFTSDGKLVATANVGSGRFSTSVRDALTGKEIRPVNIKCEAEWVKFSPDGRLLAINEADKAAIWALIP